jgi:hypothetical protein
MSSDKKSTRGASTVPNGEPTAPLPGQRCLPFDEPEAETAPVVSDIPGFEDLPSDVRERLLKARRDPTQPSAAAGPPPKVPVRVGAPARDDIFRTYPDGSGWLTVNVVTIKKGLGQDVKKKTYLVGDEAMKNPAVAERVRAGYAILTITAEGITGVWIINKPDRIGYESSYPYDQPKYEAAESARARWTTIAWDNDKGGHQWQPIDLGGQPNEKPVWPGEHPMMLIDRAIASVFVDDPDFAEFKHLTVKRSGPHE